MCWIHENKYGDCFDLVWEGMLEGERDGIKEKLEDTGIKFNDAEKCCYEFFKLLTKWHKKGLIEPMKEEDKCTCPNCDCKTLSECFGETVYANGKIINNCVCTTCVKQIGTDWIHHEEYIERVRSDSNTRK